MPFGSKAGGIEAASGQMHQYEKAPANFVVDIPRWLSTPGRLAGRKQRE